MPKETSIGISKATKKKLAELGNKGDSFEDIIKKLIAKGDDHNRDE